MLLVKESQMSLSTQVKESVTEASKLLREAIAFAARSEHPVVLVSLSEVVTKLDQLDSMDEFMSYLDETRGRIPKV
tara:strand:+ start:976 stop:1203 length:228 start_codon:yes stop_codon:yes gene_type:complete